MYGLAVRRRVLLSNAPRQVRRSKLDCLTEFDREPKETVNAFNGDARLIESNENRTKRYAKTGIHNGVHAPKY